MGASVWTLSVELGWVMQIHEVFAEGAEVDDVWIKDHFHAFSVPGGPSAHGFVFRSIHRALLVPADDVQNARQQGEPVLHAPEASSGEVADLSVGFGSLGEIIAFFVELKGFAVEAIPPPRGWGTVGEDVSKVRVAALAANFSTHHAVGTVFDFSDVPWREPAVERRPPGAAGEFAGGLKQRQSANHAAVDAVLFVVEEGAAERSFGA